MLDQQSNQNASHKPRRSWKRFSLRTLLVLTAFVALLLARWRSQLQLEREIELMVAKYEGEVSWGDGDAPGILERLHTVFGESTIWQPMSVCVSLSAMTPVERKDFFKMLGRRRNVLRVSLFDANNDSLADAGMSLTSVRNLFISGREVNDEGISHLSHLTQIEGLALNSTSVTGTGFEHFQNATKLKSLIITRSSLTLSGLESFSDLPRLEQLAFQTNQISTKSVLQVCQRVRSLKGLYIYEPIVAEEDLVRIAETLPNLRTLNGGPVKRLRRTGKAPQVPSATGTN